MVLINVINRTINNFLRAYRGGKAVPAHSCPLVLVFSKQYTNIAICEGKLISSIHVSSKNY